MTGQDKVIKDIEQLCEDVLDEKVSMTEYQLASTIRCLLKIEYLEAKVSADHNVQSDSDATKGAGLDCRYINDLQPTYDCHVDMTVCIFTHKPCNRYEDCKKCKDNPAEWAEKQPEPQQPDDDIIRVGDTVECIEKSALTGDEYGVVGKRYLVEEGESGSHITIRGNSVPVYARRFKKVKPTPKPTPEPELWICENAKKCKKGYFCLIAEPHDHPYGPFLGCCDVEGVRGSKCIPYKPEPVKDCEKCMGKDGSMECLVCTDENGKKYWKENPEPVKDEYDILDMYKKVIHPEVLAAVKEKYLYTAEKPKKKRGRPKKAKGVCGTCKYEGMGLDPCLTCGYGPQSNWKPKKKRSNKSCAAARQRKKKR